MKARWLSGLIAAALAVTVAHATTVIPMSVEQMTRAASNVVHARAVTSWSEWNPEHTAIFTYTRFEVLGQWKGGSPATLVVKQPGGTSGGYEQKVSGVRQFGENDEAVLFLRPSVAADGTMVVVGLMQGNYHVTRSAAGAVASNGVGDVKAYDAARHTITQFHGGRMALSDLQSRVRKAVGR